MVEFFAACGVGTAYHSQGPEFTLLFYPPPPGVLNVHVLVVLVLFTFVFFMFLVPCCDVRYDFLGSFLLSLFCREFMFYLRILVSIMVSIADDICVV